MIKIKSFKIKRSMEMSTKNQRNNFDKIDKIDNILNLSYHMGIQIFMT